VTGLPPAAESASPSRIPALVCMVWVVLLLLGAARAYQLTSEWRYVAVDARVEDVTVLKEARGLSRECNTAGSRSPHQVIVRYSYSLDGVMRYQSDRYDADNRGELFCRDETAAARVAELRVGSTIRAHVNPKSPTEAVLQRRELSETIFVGVVLAVSGFFVWAWYLRVRRRRAAATR
jgi:hypothetical protein